MEQARLVIAIVLSVLVFLAWQFFFVDKEADQKSASQTAQPPAQEEPVRAAQPYLEGTQKVQSDKTGVADTQVSTPGIIPKTPLKELLPQDNPFDTVLVGFAGKSLPGLDRAVFSTNAYVETVNVSDSAREVTFSWKSDLGVVVEKTYTFSPDSYLIGLDITIKNGSAQTIQDKLFVALTSTLPNDNGCTGLKDRAP